MEQVYDGLKATGNFIRYYKFLNLKGMNIPSKISKPYTGTPIEF